MIRISTNGIAANRILLPRAGAMLMSRGMTSPFNSLVDRFRDHFGAHPETLPRNVTHEVELFPRHCEEPLRRSNPFSAVCRHGLLRSARNDAFKHHVSRASIAFP